MADKGNATTRGDSPEQLTRFHDQDERLREAREEQAQNAELDSRDIPYPEGEYPTLRERGYFGYAPAGHGENDAPWAQEETGGNVEGKTGESKGKSTAKSKGGNE